LDFNLMRGELTPCVRFTHPVFARHFGAAWVYISCWMKCTSCFFRTIQKTPTACPHINPVEITLVELALKPRNAFFELLETFW